MDSTIEMPTKYGEPLQLHQIGEDILVPTLFMGVKDNLELIANIEPRKGDVLICSFPKSGSHWTGALVREILIKNVSEDQVSGYRDQRIGLLENTTQERLTSALSPRILHTHLRSRWIPTFFKSGKGKIILVLRNPKDVAVSLFHHLQKSTMFDNKQDWDEYFDSFKSGAVPYGQYLDYLDGWERTIKHNQSLDLEVFYYEDLKTKGVDTLRRLAKHLGHDLTDEKIQSVLDECSLTKLADRDNKVLKDKETPVIGKDGKTVIYRKGEIGDWKNHFTVAQNELYDKIIEKFHKKSMFAFRFE